MSTLTLNLDDRHDQALTRLAVETDMSKTGVLRQALRLYQLVHERAKDGQQMAFVKDGKVIPMITPSLMLMPLPAGVEPSQAPYCAKLAGPCPDGCASVKVARSDRPHGDCWRVKQPAIAGVALAPAAQPRVEAFIAATEAAQARGRCVSGCAIHKDGGKLCDEACEREKGKSNG
jgi:predicted transcriptional regulator